MIIEYRVKRLYIFGLLLYMLQTSTSMYIPYYLIDWIGPRIMIDFRLNMFVIEPFPCIYDGKNRRFLVIPINVIVFNAIHDTEKK